MCPQPKTPSAKLKARITNGVRFILLVSPPKGLSHVTPHSGEPRSRKRPLQFFNPPRQCTNCCTTTRRYQFSVPNVIVSLRRLETSRGFRHYCSRLRSLPRRAIRECDAKNLHRTVWHVDKGP